MNNAGAGHFVKKNHYLKAQIMKKYVVFLLLAGMSKADVYGQTGASAEHVRKGKSQMLSVSALLPVGRFADSHVVGAGLSYSWSNHRFGDSVNARKWVGFTVQGGFDYLIGKSQTVAGSRFRYGNNLYVQVMPGVICNPSAKSSVVLLAGPSLGIYKSSSSLSYAVQLSAAYCVSPKITIGPSIVYRKHAEVDALWTAGVKAGYGF